MTFIFSTFRKRNVDRRRKIDQEKIGQEKTTESLNY